MVKVRPMSGFTPSTEKKSAVTAWDVSTSGSFCSAGLRLMLA